MSRAKPQANAPIAAAQAQELAASGGDLTGTTDYSDREKLPDGEKILLDDILVLFNGPVLHSVDPKF